MRQWIVNMSYKRDTKVYIYINVKYALCKLYVM